MSIPTMERFRSRFPKLSALFFASDRRESAMNAIPSALWSTAFRVASCCTCPGTVYTFTLIFSPLGATRKKGRRSKKIVRSSFVSRTIRSPRPSFASRSCSRSRFVVFPERAGP